MNEDYFVPAAKKERNVNCQAHQEKEKISYGRCAWEREGKEMRELQVKAQEPKGGNKKWFLGPQFTVSFLGTRPSLS